MNLQDLPLDLLRSYVSFIESANMVAAAEKLRISQPLLTKHLQTLEKNAGAALFYIDGRKKRATRYGQELYEVVKKSLHGLESDVHALSLRKADPSRVAVRIGGRREILDQVPVDIGFPGRLIFEPMAGREVIRALLDRRLEIGITQHDIDSFGFVQKRYLVDQFHVAYPESWGLDGVVFRALVENLVDRPYLSYGPSDALARVAELVHLERMPEPFRVFPSWPRIVQMIERKMGWAIVPVSHLGSAKKIATSPVPEKIMASTQFHLIYAKEYAQLPWFKELLLDLSSP
jgi:DNA-binding transcriptional LysR family regulator